MKRSLSVSGVARLALTLLAALIVCKVSSSIANGDIHDVSAGYGGRKLKGESPKNWPRNLTRDVETARREQDGMFRSDVSYVKYEMAAAASGNGSYFRIVTAEDRRDGAKEKAIQDVVVLMAHNFPFTTRCMQKKALLMKKEVESLGNARFYIAHFLNQHNKTFMQAAIYDPETRTDVVYWAPVNTYLYNKKYGWELKWTVLHWLSRDTSYPRAWLVEDDVLLMDMANFVREHSSLPHKAITAGSYVETTKWRHARTCKYHGKRCFDNRGSRDDTKQLTLVLSRLDRDLAGQLSGIFLEEGYQEGHSRPLLKDSWRPPIYGHFEALGGFVVQREERRARDAGEDATLVIRRTLQQFHGNFSLGSFGRFRTMPCVATPKLVESYQRAIRYLAGEGHQFRRKYFYHPIKCCNINKVGLPKYSLGLEGQVFRTATM